MGRRSATHQTPLSWWVALNRPTKHPLEGLILEPAWSPRKRSMSLSTRPIRWFSVVLLLLVATALGLLAISTFRRNVRPRPPVPTAPGPVADRPRPQPEDGPRGPQVWVIAIGIDQYQDEQI